MMFLKSALSLLLATNASAFLIAPGAVTRRLVSHQIYSSEETAPAESSSTIETPSDPKKNLERHTVYVGNLPYGITLDEVRTMFTEHVDAGYINMPRNPETGEIKGFAFVDVPTEDDIVTVVDALNGRVMGERNLRVSKVLPKDQIRSKKTNQEPNKNKLFVGNLSFDASVDDIKEFFGQFGELTDVFIPVDSIGEPRGFAFVTCAEGDVEKVMEATNGAELLGRTLTVNPPLAPGEKKVQRQGSNKLKLYVGNLSFYTNEDTLYDVFEEFGKVYDAYIPQDPERGGSRGFGFVTMARDAGMDAIDGLDGCEIDDRIIAVNEAQQKRKGPRSYEEDEE